MEKLKTSKANAQPEPKAGQIWVEMDPRDERYVVIERVCTGQPPFVKVRRVNADGSAWPKSRSLDAMTSRFRGQRGGYAIHFNPEQ